MNDETELTPDELEYANFLKAQEGGSEPPKEQPKAEEPKPEAAQAPPEPAEPPELFPGFNALPDDAKESAKAEWQRLANDARRWQHDFQSLHGKVAPLQRELATLKKPAEPQPPKPPAPEARAKLTEWERLQQEIPKDAAAFEELVNAKVAEELGKLKPLLDKAPLLSDLEQERATRAEAVQLDQQFPGWQQTIDGDDFQIWVDSLRQAAPNRYQDVVSVLEGKSAAEHARMLRDFNLDMREIAIYEKEQEQSKPKTLKPPAPDPSSTSRAPTPAPQKSMTEEEARYDAWLATQRK